MSRHGAAEPKVVLPLPTPLATLEARVVELEREAAARRRAGIAAVVASGDLDKVQAALILATSAVAMGQPAHLFFTLWATSALRRPTPPPRRRGLVDRLFGWLLPKGTSALSLSRMHFGGMGTAMMKRRMRASGVADCDELLAMARDGGVKISVCEQTMSLMGLTQGDLVDYPDLGLCGATSFLAIADTSSATMFI